MTFPSFATARTVNDLLRETPAAAAVLNRLGIDTCCGGSLSLAEAAASVGLPLAELLAALPQPTEAA
jgi:regulator of cell morphogenesis and NO signaling